MPPSPHWCSSGSTPEAGLAGKAEPAFIEAEKTAGGLQTMGLGTFTAEEEDSGSGSNKSTYITFKNPRTADISEGSEHRHEQEYYDAAQELRNKLGQDINVPVGEFMAAAVEADEGNPERLQELFDQLVEDEE